MITDLSVRCSCGAKLAVVQGGSSATFQARRKCRKCGAQWNVTAHPAMRMNDAAVAHRVDLFCVKGASS